MQLIFQTRFAYVGDLGWRSDHSNSPEHVFKLNYLKKRFFFFENIMLPSIADQTDDDFHVHILTSDMLPPDAYDRLRDQCENSLGAERYTLTAEGKGTSWKIMRDVMAEKFGASTKAIQVALDDDDGVAVDFVEQIRQAVDYVANAAFHTSDTGSVNFSVGKALHFAGDEIMHIASDARRNCAPGMATFGPLSGDVPNIRADKLRHWPVNMVAIQPSRPMYVKTFHEQNTRHIPEEKPARSHNVPADLDIYFPFLLDLLPKQITV